MPPLGQFACRISRSLTHAVVCLLATTVTALACTTMALGSASYRLVAYSFDFGPTGVGMVVVNPVGVVRTSLYDPPRASWQARYGSVTVNQAGLGMPTAGLNTAGLVVTLMWNDDVAYEAADGRPRLNELEFIQYLLDRAGSVEEALAIAAEAQVAGMVPIHYFLADAGGDAATLAFLDGSPVVRRGETLPMSALTNLSYDVLVNRVDLFSPFGGDTVLPAVRDLPGSGLDDSVVRFAHAVLAGRETQAAASPEAAFEALSAVRSPSTRWQVVFDPVGQEVRYQTVEAPDRRAVRLGDLTFDCRTDALSIDIDDRESWSVADSLTPLTRAENLAIVTEAFGSFPHFRQFGPDFAVMLSAGQMQSVACPPS